MQDKNNARFFIFDLRIPCEKQIYNLPDPIATEDQPLEQIDKIGEKQFLIVVTKTFPGVKLLFDSCITTSGYRLLKTPCKASFRAMARVLSRAFGFAYRCNFAHARLF